MWGGTDSGNSGGSIPRKKRKQGKYYRNDGNDSCDNASDTNAVGAGAGSLSQSQSFMLLTPSSLARALEFLELHDVLQARLVCRSLVEASGDLDPSWCAAAFQVGLQRRNATMVQVWRPPPTPPLEVTSSLTLKNNDNNGHNDDKHSHQAKATVLDSKSPPQNENENGFTLETANNTQDNDSDNDNSDNDNEDGRPLQVDETNLFPIRAQDEEDDDYERRRRRILVKEAGHGTAPISTSSSHFDKMLHCFQALCYVPEEAVVRFDVAHGRHVMPLSPLTGNMVQYGPCTNNSNSARVGRAQINIPRKHETNDDAAHAATKNTTRTDNHVLAAAAAGSVDVDVDQNGITRTSDGEIIKGEQQQQPPPSRDDDDDCPDTKSNSCNHIHPNTNTNNTGSMINMSMNIPRKKRPRRSSASDCETKVDVDHSASTFTPVSSEALGILALAAKLENKGTGTKGSAAPCAAATDSYSHTRVDDCHDCHNNHTDTDDCPTCCARIPPMVPREELDSRRRRSSWPAFKPTSLADIMYTLADVHHAPGPLDLSSYYKTCVRNLPPTSTLRCPHCRSQKRTLVLATISYKSDTRYRPGHDHDVMLSYTPQQLNSTQSHEFNESDSSGSGSATSDSDVDVDRDDGDFYDDDGDGDGNAEVDTAEYEEDFVDEDDFMVNDGDEGFEEVDDHDDHDDDDHDRCADDDEEFDDGVVAMEEESSDSDNDDNNNEEDRTTHSSSLPTKSDTIDKSSNETKTEEEEAFTAVPPLSLSNNAKVKHNDDNTYTDDDDNKENHDAEQAGGFSSADEGAAFSDADDNDNDNDNDQDKQTTETSLNEENDNDGFTTKVTVPPPPNTEHENEKEEGDYAKSKSLLLLSNEETDAAAAGCFSSADEEEKEKEGGEACSDPADPVVGEDSEHAHDKKEKEKDNQHQGKKNDKPPPPPPPTESATPFSPKAETDTQATLTIPSATTKANEQEEETKGAAIIPNVETVNGAPHEAVGTTKATVPFLVKQEQTGSQMDVDVDADNKSSISIVREVEVDHIHINVKKEKRIRKSNAIIDDEDADEDEDAAKAEDEVASKSNKAGICADTTMTIMDSSKTEHVAVADTQPPPAGSDDKADTETNAEETVLGLDGKQECRSGNNLSESNRNQGILVAGEKKPTKSPDTLPISSDEPCLDEKIIVVIDNHNKDDTEEVAGHTATSTTDGCTSTSISENANGAEPLLFDKAATSRLQDAETVPPAVGAAASAASTTSRQDTTAEVSEHAYEYAKKCYFPNVKEYAVRGRETLRMFERDSSTKHALVLCCVGCYEFGIAIPAKVCMAGDGDGTNMDGGCWFEEARHVEEASTSKVKVGGDRSASIAKEVRVVADGTTFTTKVCASDDCFNAAQQCRTCHLRSHTIRCAEPRECGDCSSDVYTSSRGGKYLQCRCQNNVNHHSNHSSDDDDDNMLDADSGVGSDNNDNVPRRKNHQNGEDNNNTMGSTDEGNGVRLTAGFSSEDDDDESDSRSDRVEPFYQQQEQWEEDEDNEDEAEWDGDC
jgi:hypothetical protein